MSNPRQSEPTTEPESGNTDAFLCSICKETFSKLDALTRHIRSHTHKFFCQTCSKGFPRADLLERHSTTTTHKRQSRKSQDSRISLGQVSRACIQCASARAKCSDGHPCNCCKSKGLKCSLRPQQSSRKSRIRRVSQACIQCASARKGCSDVHPCSRCKSKGLECSLGPQQSSRISQVCIQCASARKGCSDGHPCSRCKSKGIECSLETLEQQDSHPSEHFQYCQAQEKATWEEAERYQVANYANPQTNSSQQFQFSGEVWISSPNQSNNPASQNSELAAGSQNMLSSQIDGYAYLPLINPWDAIHLHVEEDRLQDGGVEEL